MIISWLGVLLWMGLIFYFSAQVGEDSGNLSFNITEIAFKIVKKIAPYMDIDTFHHFIRKGAHFTVYLILGILSLNAFQKSKLLGSKGIVFALGLCILYAISDEIHQAFVPGRGPSMKDVGIDSLGSMMGIGIYLLFK